MTGNTFGRMFRVTTCGESYSGCFRKTPDIPKELYGGLLTIVDGCPPGRAHYGGGHPARAGQA